MRQVHALYLPDRGKADLDLVLPPGPVHANWDGDMVKRAIINFADNALHAVQGNGKITLAVAAAGNMARLSVTDDGPGVPQEARTQLFEPYFSTKPRGTGLGLAIARKIAEDHGGAATYEALERGSVFSLELPVK
jgi:signal transduction histidine kinase